MFAALPVKWEILISMISLGSREPWRKSERHYLRDMGAKVKEKGEKIKQQQKKNIMVCAFETLPASL